MSFKKWGTGACMFFLIFMATANQGTGISADLARAKGDPQESSRIEFITAEELKAQIEKNQPLTIIDVRSNYASGNDEQRITGAIHVKLRRLRTRLSFPPLKDAPRDRQVVTYCACPSDEASIRAAQLLLGERFTRVRVLKGGWVAWQKVNRPI
ncbi:MAG: rhodanese-like domain-containing protein [Pyrinomonadaceae bacterium]